jgi:hypothetical protein
VSPQQGPAISFRRVHLSGNGSPLARFYSGNADVSRCRDETSPGGDRKPATGDVKDDAEGKNSAEISSPPQRRPRRSAADKALKNFELGIIRSLALFAQLRQRSTLAPVTANAAFRKKGLEEEEEEEEEEQEDSSDDEGGRRSRGKSRGKGGGRARPAAAEPAAAEEEQDDNDEHCSVCLSGLLTRVCCSGPCHRCAPLSPPAPLPRCGALTAGGRAGRRTYHPTCAGMKDESEIPEGDWYCADCRAGRRVCQICFTPGPGPFLLGCAFPRCENRFHSACVGGALPVSDGILPFSAGAVPPMWCPSHHCAACQGHTNAIESDRLFRHCAPRPRPRRRRADARDAPRRAARVCKAADRRAQVRAVSPGDARALHPGGASGGGAMAADRPPLPRAGPARPHRARSEWLKCVRSCFLDPARSSESLGARGSGR